MTDQNDRRPLTFALKLTPPLRHMIRQAAASADEEVGAWMRRTLERAARKQLNETGTGQE